MRDGCGGCSSEEERLVIVRKLSSRVVALCVTALAAMVLVACGDDKKADDGKTTGEVKKLHVAYANAVEGDPTLDQMRRLTEALAKQRGWEYTYVNNNVDGPTAVSNAKLLANKRVDAVIEFQIDQTVMPKISRIFEAADIPWMSYSVAAPNAWIIGGSDAQAGIDAGRALGRIATEKWACELDLMVILTDPAIPSVAARSRKARDGFLEVCPGTEDKIKEFPLRGEGDAAAIAQAVARDALVANPGGTKILFAGQTDEQVSAGLTAAKQLGRYDDAWAWGQGGDAIVLPEFDPHLLGSVMYFLEGYPAYAFRVLDQIAAGNPPPKGPEDTTESETAISSESCSMTAEQVRAIPDLETRVDELIAAPKGTTIGDLYCPKDEG